MSILKRKKVKRKNNKIILIVLAILLIILMAKLLIDKNINKLEEIDSELARSMTYTQFEESDFATESEFVQFGAFFLRDLNGDGYAEKVAGSCREIGKTDTLYLNISVNTEGYFENGVITIDGKNFNLRTAIVKDSVITNNKISTDTKSIELNKLLPGTTKLLMGATGVKINTKEDYSSSENTVTLTGTYVDGSGNRTEINKVITLTVDWYGSLNTQITTSTETVYADESIDEEEGTIDVKLKITTQETKKQLILTESHVKGAVPSLNGYMATEVILEGTNGTLEYNAETGEFTIVRTGEDLAKTNAYTVIITYPLEAYETIEEEIVTMQIPIESYYVGENNPNEEFENPITSNIASKAITVVIEKEKEETSEEPVFSVTVGKYATIPTKRYVISKKNAISRYMGEEVDGNTEYTVQWRIQTGENPLNGIKLEETKSDTIYNSSTGVEESLAEYTTYTGIYFVSAGAVLGQDGYIKVIDEETDEVIHTFTAADWDTYTANNPYEYEASIGNIRIETSKAAEETTLIVYNIKELDDEKIIANYTKETFDKLTKISGYLTGTAITETEDTQNVRATANYEEEISIATIKTSKTELTTQDTEEGITLTIGVQTNGYNLAGWKNGEFIVKFPKDIAFVKINKVLVNTGLVEILGYELYKEGDNNLLKIVTSNEKETGYEITINCDIEADPRIATTIDKVELYATNENCKNYAIGYNAEDNYDIDSDENKTELVGYNNVQVTLLAPVMLTTAQIATEYNDAGDTIIAPQIAEIVPEVIVDKTEEMEQTAKITVQIRNNYGGTISETKILGKIPFTGNTDGITGRELGSTYTTTMKSPGLSIPTELEGKVTIYYSSNENPTNDLSDTNNGWTETPEDWSQVKTFLIDFEEYALSEQEESEFTYQIAIPEKVNYNQISYSIHTIEFYLDTDEGKLKQEIEPRKLGFRIARKYDLELTKYRKTTDITIPGVTFKLTEINENEEEVESKIRTTDGNGILRIEDLYVERTYILKEIKTGSEYELNSEEIKFTATVDEVGDLHIQVISGNFKDGNIEITQTSEITDGSNPSIHVAIENEIKYNLNIVKEDIGTSEKLRGIRFTLEGAGKTRTITTNSAGQINLKGLKIGEEYTLTETKAEGYYIIKPITFVINRNDNGELVQTVTNDEGDSVTHSIVEVEGTICPTLKLEIKNEKIPTYNLKVLKVSSKTELTTSTGDASETTEGLEGAQFEIYSYDTGEKEIYTTDENGEISIEGLYEYIDGKSITGQYYIKEIYAPVGYSVNDIIMTFRAQRNAEGNLILTIVEGSALLADVEAVSGVAYDLDGNEITTKAVTIENASTEEATIGLTIANEPIFSLVKLDKETNEPLEGAKFVIYEIDENNEIIDYAKDIDGNIIGTKEIIDEREYYVLATNKSGQITAKLGAGYYKTVEIAVPEGYEFETNEEDRTYYFGIEQSKPAEREVTEIYNKADFDGQTVTFTDMKMASDGGYVVVGYFAGDLKFEQNETANNEEIIISKTTNGNPDGLIIKYNSEGLVEWANKTYGSTYNYCRAVDIVDDGYIVAVEGKNLTIDAEQTVNNTKITVTALDYDFIVVKYSLDGKIEWASNVGGSVAEYIKDIKAFSDGGFVVTGYSKSATITIPADKTNDGNEDIILTSNSTTSYTDSLTIKYNSEGLIEWASNLSIENSNVYAKAVNKYEDTEETENTVILLQLSSTLIIPALETENGIADIELTINGGSDIAIIEYNSQGLVKKAITFGSTGNDDCSDIISTNDNGLMIAGKIANNMTVESEKTVSGNSISLTNGGVLLKYNSDGLIDWAMKVGNYSNINFTKVIQNKNDMGYIVIGQIKGDLTIDGTYTDDGNAISISNNGDFDSLILKCTSEGKIEWVQTLGSEVADTYTSVDNIDEGKYIVIGRFNSEEIKNGLSGSVVLVYNDNGEESLANSLKEKAQIYNSVKITTDGGTITVGNFTGILNVLGEDTVLGNNIEMKSKGNTDSLIVKYNKEGLIEWIDTLGGIYADTYSEIIEIDGGYITVGRFGNSSGGSVIIPKEKTVDNQEIVVTSKGNSDGIIVKYTKEGLIEWVKRLGGTSGDNMTSISMTYDEGYIVGRRFFRNHDNTSRTNYK